MIKRMWRLVALLGLAGTMVVLPGFKQAHATADLSQYRSTITGSQLQSQALEAAPAFSVSYTGVDYIDPGSTFTGCLEWTWLQANCYTNTTKGSADISPQQLFSADLSFMNKQHMGSFQRVWISLDQLMLNWNSTTGYSSYDPQALANVDDMLHRASAAGIKLDLVLFSYSGGSLLNSFDPAALDGKHTAMRANYLQALHDFVAHVAADPQDASAIAVMDLQQEGYYQLETYFLSTPANLGTWNHSMPPWPQSNQCYVLGNTLCTGGSAGHGCGADTTCIDVNILEPWFAALYATAKAAGSNFNYTISDGTRSLLTTDTSAYSSQAWWVSMYPVDVYDIHLYNATPWTQSARWATGLTLPKPWFSGETGCSPIDTSCTYNSSTLSAVDPWWLQNMAADGARAVLVEDKHTSWRYTYTGNGQGTSGEVPTLTLTGQFIAATTLALPTSAVFTNSFDGQGAGALQEGSTLNQFTGVAGGPAPTVESSVAASAPNALVSTLIGGGSSFAFAQYATGYASHDLRFRLLLGADMSLPAASYLVLAQTGPATTALPGKVDLVMNGAGTLFLDYFDGSGARHYLWTTGAPLTRGVWHSLELRQSTVSLQLVVDGQTIEQASGLNLGTAGVRYFAVGDVYTPRNATTTGHLYVDDVTTSTA